VNPKHYKSWSWFGGELRYIGSAEGRIEHMVFKSKVLSACGVPILALGIFATDDFFEWASVFGISLALMFLSIALRWIFDSDAANRGEYTVEDFQSRAERPVEDVSMEELEKARERD